ncbi:uroporphyrinogen-III synthase [Brevundimonas sp. PAMC22021]|uniref:uroporphyrinogen-III synthase n=1 Tax=Brevundimonas sp. PAMC22021 TaxID=2861285 RepID=UPI001C6249E9|nr:uroporphyrinogen-III synthase [Brevundimonas sp. PAMC22021]QYF87122.1 uroporphyrinogen-III synthase [Brevundimonas sp. PAMC22021]
MSPEAPRVWVTRAEPGAGRTAARLRELGCQPIVAPVLKIERINGVPIDLDGVAALAFTSINGVSAFAALSNRRDRPAFCVGDATAEAARQVGFADVCSASGDVEALGRLIAAAELPGMVLAPGAEQPAGDLGAYVGGSTPVRRLVVYRTIETSVAPPSCDAVLIHSPRAGCVLRPLIEAMPERPFAVAISPAAARPLADLLSCAIADRPDETALLAALLATLGKPLPPV